VVPSETISPAAAVVSRLIPVNKTSKRC
jgi:hypothetical protein